MAKEEKDEAAPVAPKAKAPAQIRVTNKQNAPYDLAFVNLGKTFRLEPRGNYGDSVLLDAELVAHPDFQSARDYVIVG